MGYDFTKGMAGALTGGLTAYSGVMKSQMKEETWQREQAALEQRSRNMAQFNRDIGEEDRERDFSLRERTLTEAENRSAQSQANWDTTNKQQIEITELNRAKEAFTPSGRHIKNPDGSFRELMVSEARNMKSSDFAKTSDVQAWQTSEQGKAAIKAGQAKVKAAIDLQSTILKDAGASKELIKAMEVDFATGGKYLPLLAAGEKEGKSDKEVRSLYAGYLKENIKEIDTNDPAQLKAASDKAHQMTLATIEGSDIISGSKDRREVLPTALKGSNEIREEIEPPSEEIQKRLDANIESFFSYKYNKAPALAKIKEVSTSRPQDALALINSIKNSGRLTNSRERKQLEDLEISIRNNISTTTRAEQRKVLGALTPGAIHSTLR